MGLSMGLTYFKRYRMEIDLRQTHFAPDMVPLPYSLTAWASSLVEAHAEAKFSSFCYEIDANVFPCLGNREGCYRLMREIARRDGFLPSATWLLESSGENGTSEVCGTIQGVRDNRGFGAIQNLGITPGHRGLGLGTTLLFRTLRGFQEVGLQQAYLEVTAQNVGAVRLYERLGFHTVRTVYKAADVAYA
jgi:ribosomal protein S18 acetylase RimI-like enzyme